MVWQDVSCGGCCAQCCGYKFHTNNIDLDKIVVSTLAHISVRRSNVRCRMWTRSQRSLRAVKGLALSSCRMVMAIMRCLSSLNSLNKSRRRFKWLKKTLNYGHMQSSARHLAKLIEYCILPPADFVFVLYFIQLNTFVESNTLGAAVTRWEEHRARWAGSLAHCS